MVGLPPGCRIQEVRSTAVKRFQGLDSEPAAQGGPPTAQQPSALATAGRAFRARPLDANKPLELITDISQLDSTEGLPARDVVHNHAALDADNEKVGSGCAPSWSAARPARFGRRRWGIGRGEWTITPRRLAPCRPPCAAALAPSGCPGCQPWAVGHPCLPQATATGLGAPRWRCCSRRGASLPPTPPPLPTHSPATPPQPKMIEQSQGGIKEIPIPGILNIPTYRTDYLPVRRERNTYIRPKGEPRHGGWQRGAGAVGQAGWLAGRCAVTRAAQQGGRGAGHSASAAAACFPQRNAWWVLPWRVCAGGVGYDDPIFVEYDMDSEDERWLRQYNGSEVGAAALGSQGGREAV